MNRTNSEIQAPPTLRVNIPIMLTSFIGRKREIAEVKRLLAASRLVTLTGAAGCGKTRLTLRVATDVDIHYVHGVHWVELARLADARLVSQAVAQTVKVVEQPGRPLLDSLLDALQDKQLLLVLDNCEHLLKACAQLVETLVAVPGVSILATSREPLGITGEMLYPVSPMALPPGSLPANDLAEFDVMQLFVERARAILPHFALTSDNAAVIAGICQDLDGIPLAIELASARVNMLAVEQIAARLDDRLDLVAAATHVDHHRTLRAAIDWSYDLLSPPEQVILMRLSVFTGGCSISTAEAVCAGDGIEREQVFELLSSLVNKSLVMAQTLEGSEARYRLLETIRQYVQEKLFASGEWDAAHDHYLDCFLLLVEEIAPKLREKYQQFWLNWLETENDNIRAALAWALKQQHIERGLRIAISLSGFWDARGYIQEGSSWYERLLHHADDTVPLAVRSNALTYSSFLAMFLGDAATATLRGREAVALCEAAGEEGKPLLAFALAGLVSGRKGSR